MGQLAGSVRRIAVAELRRGHGVRFAFRRLASPRAQGTPLGIQGFCHFDRGSDRLGFASVPQAVAAPPNASTGGGAQITDIQHVNDRWDNVSVYFPAMDRVVVNDVLKAPDGHPARRPSVHAGVRRTADDDIAPDVHRVRRRCRGGAANRRQAGLRDVTGNIRTLVIVVLTVRMKCPAESRQRCEGLNGFDFAHRIKGSVPVQARDHRKRRCNQLSADSNQRDFALAA
jgi:hypothetical protein